MLAKVAAFAQEVGHRQRNRVPPVIYTAVPGPGGRVSRDMCLRTSSSVIVIRPIFARIRLSPLAQL